MTSDDAPKELAELDWAPVLAHLPWLRSDDARFGRLVEAVEHPDGGYTMPYEALSPQAEAVVTSLVETGVVAPGIDWSRWLDGDGEALMADVDGSAIATAPLVDLRRLLVALVRGARFNEGLLLRAFSSGQVRRILERVEELVR